MSTDTLPEPTHRRWSKKARAAAERTARARQTRKRLGRPERRDVELGFGDALLSALLGRGAVRQDGTVDDQVLALHPDLAEVYRAAMEALERRFAPAQLADVLQSRLAAQWSPDAKISPAAAELALGRAFCAVIARVHPDLRHSRQVGGKMVPVAGVMASAVGVLTRDGGHSTEKAVPAVSARVKEAIGEHTDSSALVEALS